MYRSAFSIPVEYSNRHAVKVKRSLLRQKPTEFIKISKTKQAQKVKNINYLDLSSQCSKVIDFGQRHEKKGRPAGHKKLLKSIQKQNATKKCQKKKDCCQKKNEACCQKKKEVCCQTESKIDNKEVFLETQVVSLPDLQATTTVKVLDREQWEKRKKSIKAKLVLRRENLLTKDEEQDIHMRADVYSITTIPDAEFYVLPEYDIMPRVPMQVEEITIDTSYPPVRKKRRRNYGSSDCYVNIHNKEDIYDNTKMLPIGTRLIKPPNKLVELVAQAVDGSPDGLLQVQQIYTYLQNRYPYFRYMERGAINSWRSSIRHALYQKWFRKIRFDLSYISCKGCYWAINHKSSPREWTMPPHSCDHMVIGREEQKLIENLESFNTIYNRQVGRYLQEDQTADENLELVTAAQEYETQVINNCLSQSSNEEFIDVENHIPSPVKEPDPILATCAPDWLSDDLYYVPKCDINNIDMLCPASSTSETLLSPSLSSPVYSSPDEIGTDLQLGTPINSPVQQNLGILTSVDHKTMKKCNKKAQGVLADIENEKVTVPALGDKSSNLVSSAAPVTPDKERSKSDWKQSKSLVLSPINSRSSSTMFVFGYPSKLQDDDLEDIDMDMIPEIDHIDTEFYSTFNNISGVLKSMENGSSDTCGSEGSLCDFDIIAEFSKYSGQSSPIDIDSMMIYG